jgi:hypothetical protein
VALLRCEFSASEFISVCVMRQLSDMQGEGTTVNITFVFFSSRAQLVNLVTPICFIFRNA